MKKLPPTLLALAIFTLGIGLSVSQDAPKKKNSSVKDPAVKAAAARDLPKAELGILIEYIRLDHKTANQLVRTHSPSAADAQKLRDELEELIEAGNATLDDTQWLRAKSGQRAKEESITERIYPTEYDPPEIPNNTGSIAAVKSKDNQAEADRQAHALNQLQPPTTGIFPMTSANPTAFETRNLGLILEVDPVITDGSKTIELNLAAEITTELELTYFTREGREETAKGIDHIMMPTFYARKVTTQLEVIPGNYNLLAIQKPHDDNGDRILVLLRADLVPIKE